MNKGILEIQNRRRKIHKYSIYKYERLNFKRRNCSTRTKANINPNEFNHAKTKGEFYKNLIGLLKNINYKVSYSNCYFNSMKPTLTIVRVGFMLLDVSILLLE